jgi:hypothetical protein
MLPEQAATVDDALRIADQRMYRHKASRPNQIDRRESDGPRSDGELRAVSAPA